MLNKKNIQERTLDNTIAGIFSFVIYFAQSIVLVPLFLKYWGNEKYSLWITIYAFVSLMRTIDLGHQNFIGNEFNRLYFQDVHLAKMLLSSSIKVGYCLGFLELFIFLLIWFFGMDSDLIGVDIKRYKLSGGVLSFLIMWLLVGCIAGILVRIIIALGKYSRMTYFGIIMKVVELAVMVYCIYFQRSINILCYILSFSWLLYSLILFWEMKRLVPAFYPWWQGGNFRIGIQNLNKSVILTLNGFLEQFNTNGLIFLITKFTSLAAVPIFTTIRTVTNSVTQITSLILNPLAPEMIRYYATGENSKIKKVIDTNWFISGLLVNIPFMLMAPFIEYLYTWWTKGKLPFNLFLFYTLALSVSVINIGKSYITFISGINKLRAMIIITLCRFGLILTFSILFLQWQGLLGLGLAILAAEIISSAILPSFFAHRLLEKHGSFLSNTHFLAAVSQTIVLGLYYWLHYKFESYSVLLFVLSLSVLILISCLQWKLLDDDVKSRIFSLRESLFIKKISVKNP